MFWEGSRRAERQGTSSGEGEPPPWGCERGTAAALCFLLTAAEPRRFLPQRHSKVHALSHLDSLPSKKAEGVSKDLQRLHLLSVDSFQVSFHGQVLRKGREGGREKGKTGQVQDTPSAAFQRGLGQPKAFCCLGQRTRRYTPPPKTKQAGSCIFSFYVHKDQSWKKDIFFTTAPRIP